ncbi:MAG: ABC transporter ATP-binding protein [Thalassobaculum sp.]|uniref:ABC transporter ATP-binding protein n=1 Tax=Thalassobaculum sp. TaxID=2022740 RepID=UPI0032EE3FD4
MDALSVGPQAAPRAVPRAAAAADPDVILSVRDLKTRFFTRDGVVRAVDGVSFDVRRGETLCIVGESGCGKSVTALSAMRLIPEDVGRIVGGSIHFEGRDLATLSEREMRRIRGNSMSMIFQEPMTSLNPVLTVGSQIAESARIHQGLGKRAAWERAVEMLSLVKIADPRQRAGEYPHQLSGGMRQRVMIAIALACNPKLLIADEPTTALDVTIQAQILNLMLELKERLGTAIVLITHDLGVVAETAQRAIVMYAGRKVEEAPVGELFRNPTHPYTRGLMNSIPRRSAKGRGAGLRGRLQEIAGIVPSLREDIPGCAFAPRCGFAVERCTMETPVLEPQGPRHLAACWEAAHVAAQPR